jgi:hypothetical protein
VVVRGRDNRRNQRFGLLHERRLPHVIGPLSCQWPVRVRDFDVRGWRWCRDVRGWRWCRDVWGGRWCRNMGRRGRWRGGWCSLSKWGGTDEHGSYRQRRGQLPTMPVTLDELAHVK